MPLLQKELSILDDDFSNLRKLVAAKTAIVRQFHRLKPKLRVSPRVSHMYMRWLATLQAEEKEPITADPQQGGHDSVYRCPEARTIFTGAADSQDGCF
jgi:hypothetical protein